MADPCAVNFDTLPPGLTSLSALTSLHLNNCFAEAEPHAFCGPPQLQHLALEVRTGAITRVSTDERPDASATQAAAQRCSTSMRLAP